MLTFLKIGDKMLAHKQFEDEQTSKPESSDFVPGSVQEERGERNMEEFDSCYRNMPDPRQIGHMIREMNGAFKKKFLTCGMAAGLDEVTLMHGWIMGYLYHNQEQAIYQKTIESDFCIKRSTVTTILQLMEKKGYIRREAVEGDARLKQIFLTEQGAEIAARTQEMIENMENMVIEGIAEDKLAIFYEVAQKLVTNMNQ